MRHFGLSLISHSIQYNFLTYDEPRRQAVRNWVIDLATAVSNDDPHFIKEKIAVLWVEIAKRVWGMEPDSNNHAELTGTDGWADMDSQLLQMWYDGGSRRELTFIIYRTLFEDVYMLDDPVASKRATVLTAQSIEVVTSEEILNAAYDVRVDTLKKLRADPEGWLNRWSTFLGECLQRDGQMNDQTRETFAIKALETLKTCLYWTFPVAIRKANLLERLSNALTVNNVKIKILATDCLHVLFTRTFTDDDDFQAIIGAVFLPEGLQTLSQVYDSIQVDVDDFDEKSYVLLKKVVEMIVGLGEYLNAKAKLPENADFDGYLQLVLKTTMHPSLVVSGFSLQFWCSVLRIDSLITRPDIQRLLPRLLETAADRCIKYEDVGEEHLSRRFLDMDFDSTPESHVFLGNYRRFVEDIVRLIVCLIPIDSVNWLKGRMEQFFNSQSGWESLNSNSLQHSGSPPYYMAYSQFILVEAALRGISRWKLWYTGPNKDEIAPQLSLSVQDWGEKIIGMSINDPLLLRKMVQSLVQFAPVLKDDSPRLMFAVLERVLTACTTEYPVDSSDEKTEMIRDLRTSCGTELNRLAYMIPEALMTIYDDLERVIGGIISSDKLTDHEAVSFKSFLLVVSQRSKVPNKADKFAAIVDPVLQSWSDEGTVKGLSDLTWFMERLGIVKIAEYFRSRGVTAQSNLFNTPMDDQGRALKADLKKSWSELFPIRATRIFIQYTIEKLDHSSDEYKDLLALWKPRVQPILPHILQLAAQIQAYHNPANWGSLPPEVQSFVRYSCQERFWQVGVSTQTKDEFVDENVKAMHTLRDFADSVGHIIRYTREYVFLTLGSISQLELTLYEIPGIAKDLWRALAGDSAGITCHSWRHMISLVLRNMVKNCPLEYVEPFMLEFLPPMLSKLDEVLVEKWERVYQKGVMLVGGEDDDSLSEEMMEEHLLRQLTAIVDRLLIDLVGQLGNKQSQSMGDNRLKRFEAIKNIVLDKEEVLAPFLTLCCHILTFKDVRCSYNCSLIVRNILPGIMLRSNDVDMFLCNNVMKTCLEVLGDPYFADVHNEVGYIVTTIYTTLRSRNTWPLEALSRLLPGVPMEQLEDFESRLSVPKSLRQQRGVFLEFLSVVNAMQQRDDSTTARDAQRQKAEKKLDKNKWLTKKSNQGGNLMDEEGLEGSAIANLFGE